MKQDVNFLITESASVSRALLWFLPLLCLFSILFGVIYFKELQHENIKNQWITLNSENTFNNDSSVDGVKLIKDSQFNPVSSKKNDVADMFNYFLVMDIENAVIKSFSFNDSGSVEISGSSKSIGELISVIAYINEHKYFKSTLYDSLIVNREQNQIEWQLLWP